MSHALRVAALALLALTATRPLAAAERVFQDAKHGGGELRYVDGVPVLFLEGTPEEIGRQEAALVLEAVRPMLGLPRKMIGEREAAFGWPVVVGLARGLVARSPDRYRGEIDSAATAAGLTPDEKDAFVVANAMIELRRIGGCSAVLVEPARSATGGTLFGRNFDFPAFGKLDQLGLVSVVKPTGKKAFAAIGFPALVGVVSGMNEDGLAVATLDVYDSNDGSPMFDPLGTPLSLTYRRILEECATIDEAETLLSGLRHTTWMNLAACDTRKAVVFEITPKGVAVRPADGGPLVCTNHFRTDGLCVTKTCRRFDAITAAVGDRDRIGVADVRRALHSAHQGDLTIQSMVFEPGPRVLHVALGKPPVTEAPAVRLDLKAWFAR